MDQFDLFGGEESKRRRDEGRDRIAANNARWMELAMEAIAKVPSGWTGRSEQWRSLVEAVAGKPTKPHAYGALTSKLIKAGIIRRTGVRSAMTRKKSHARMTDEYRRT